MATKTVRNGRKPSELDIALMTLIQNQAKLVSTMAASDRRWNEQKEQSEKRFANIERLLIQHNEYLKALPDAIKEKIGFQKN
jgi:hypothetical protein